MKIMIIWNGRKLKEISDEQIISAEKAAQHISEIIESFGEKVLHNKYVPVLNGKVIQHGQQLYKELVKAIKNKRNCVITLVEPEILMRKEKVVNESVLMLATPLLTRVG